MNKETKDVLTVIRAQDDQLATLICFLNAGLDMYLLSICQTFDGLTEEAALVDKPTISKAMLVDFLARNIKEGGLCLV